MQASPTQQPAEAKLVTLSLFKIRVTAYIGGLEYLLAFVFAHGIRFRGWELPQPYRQATISPCERLPPKKTRARSPVVAFFRSIRTQTTCSFAPGNCR